MQSPQMQRTLEPRKRVYMAAAKIAPCQLRKLSHARMACAELFREYSFIQPAWLTVQLASTNTGAVCLALLALGKRLGLLVGKRVFACLEFYPQWRPLQVECLTE